jgi:predicted site-specific integrase-resolvase
MKNNIDKTENEVQTQPLLLDIYAAAQRLSVAPVTIRKLVRQGRLSRVPNIRKLLIPDASAQKFAASAQ